MQELLAQREREGNLRSLKVSNNLVDFFSNDYIGFAKSSELRESIHSKFLNIHSNLNGATGSRLLSGNATYTEEVEIKLASFFNGEKALLFNSGYNANLSILSCVPQKGDTIIYDEYIHASLKEGARLSFAKRFFFRHNNLEDLEKKLKKAEGEKYVVVESIYSMDGDSCPLEKLIELTEKYQAHIILDEAHSTGIWGETGNGIACFKKLENKIFARIYTFGKAMGIHGGCIVGSELLIRFLINFARPFIYTTSLPPHSIASIDVAFDAIKYRKDLRKTLTSKIRLFKEEARKWSHKELLIASESPIQVLKVSENENAKKVSNHLLNEGFDVRPILSPTVREGEERLRICLHTFNSDEDIISLSNSIKNHFNPL